MMPVFSIIIPTYNSAKLLQSCLDSIYSQTFNNYEILVIDGASADDTAGVIDSYAGQRPLIRFFSEKDRGIYDAMNKGIKLSKGTWLYFLGCDDRLFETTTLEQVAARIEAGDQSTEVLYGDVYSERFNGLYDGEFNHSKILKNNISHQAIFFKRTVFDKTGYFDLKYRAQADWDHNLKWFLSNRVQKQYMKVTVALYADGGFSSLNGDDIFYADLRANYLRYGKHTLSLWEKLSVFGYEVLKGIKRGELKRITKIFRSL